MDSDWAWGYVIVYRQCDANYPFLWEDDQQMPARWHSAGDGPVQYFADSPDGAWSEFLRHEEITDLAELAGVSRAIWAVEVDHAGWETPALRLSIMQGGESSYPDCQAEARSLRDQGALGLVAPSAALDPGEAAGFRVEDGLRRAEARDPLVFVLFGAQPQLVGWQIASDARPTARVLSAVRHF